MPRDHFDQLPEFEQRHREMNRLRQQNQQEESQREGERRRQKDEKKRRALQEQYWAEQEKRQVKQQEEEQKRKQEEKEKRQALEKERKRQEIVIAQFSKLLLEEEKADKSTVFDIFTDLDESKGQSKENENGELLTAFIQKAFEAVNKSDLAMLRVYLGPNVHAIKQEHRKQCYLRFKQLLKVKPQADFYAKVIHIIKWYMRKRAYDVLWLQYEKKINEKRQQLNTLAQQATTSEARQIVVGLLETKEELTSGTGQIPITALQVEMTTLQEEIASYEKLTTLYSSLEAIKKTDDLNAYVSALQSSHFKELYLFLTQSEKAYLQQKVLHYKQFDLQEDEIGNLISLIKKLKQPKLNLSGLRVLMTAADDNPTHISSKKEQKIAQEPSEQKLPRMMAQRFSLSSPLTRSVDVSDKCKTESKSLMVFSSSPIGEPEWHDQHQLILAQQQRPNEANVDEWLKIAEDIIQTKANLAEILLALEKIYRPLQELCEKYQEKQKSEKIAFEQQKKAIEDQFDGVANEWIKSKGDKSLNINAKNIIDSTIGDLSPDALCIGDLAQNRIHLLHDAMRKYKAAPTAHSKEIIKYLLERGASPFALCKVDGKDLTAFQACWEGGETPDWDLLADVFKHLPTFNSLTEEICTYIANTYCPVSKTEEAGFFYGFFHSRETKKARRVDLVELGQLVYDAAGHFGDAIPLVWIYQKTGNIIPEKLKEIAATLTSARQATRSSSSALFKKLLTFAQEAEAGRLDYFMPMNAVHLLDFSSEQADVQPTVSSSVSIPTLII